MGLTRKVIFVCVLLLFKMLVFAYVLTEKKVWEMPDFQKTQKKRKKTQKTKFDRVLCCPEAQNRAFGRHFW